MSILFIRGFATDINSNYACKFAYSSFDNFFMMSQYNLEYFNYSPEEDLPDVYTKLCDKIENNLFDVIIGHSLGGGLLLKFLTEHKNYMDCISNTNKKIIFIMPIIVKDNILVDILAKNPLVPQLYLPKFLSCPNNNLYEHGNILNDDLYPIANKQIGTMYNDYINKMDLSIIDSDNCHMIYAKGELINVMSQQTLDKIKNKTILEGKHEMFSEASHSIKFFKTMKSLLEKRSDNVTINSLPSDT